METQRTKVLVTGATGFLGKALAKRLTDNGYAVRALARTTSNWRALRDRGAEVVLGDLGDASSIVSAANDMDIVVHAAAGTSGTAHESEVATVQGTRHVLEACRATRVKKLIYISSCNVYEVAGCADHQRIDEMAQLERFPERRGHYSAAKLKAENLVTKSNQGDSLRTVVLRPGTIYGPGSELFTNIIGVSLARKLFVVFGNGRAELPLIHVENVVDAIVGCMRDTGASNEVFNVVDQEVVTKRMYMNQVIKRAYPYAAVLYFPMSLLIALTWLHEKLFTIVGRQPFLTVYRLMSSQRRVRYDVSKIEKMIGWRSRVKFEQGAEQLVAGHRSSNRSQR